MRQTLPLRERGGREPVKEIDELYLAFLDSAANDGPRRIAVATKWLLCKASRLPSGLCTEVSWITTPLLNQHPVSPLTRFIKTARLHPDQRAQTIAHVASFLVASERSLVPFQDIRRFAVGALDQGSYVLSSLDSRHGPGAGRSTMSEHLCGQLDRYVEHFVERRTQAPVDEWAGWVALAKLAAETADFVSEASAPKLHS